MALGKVIDRATLKTVFASITAALATAIPIIFALAEKQMKTSAAVCAATAGALALVRATFTNSSCNYTNLTIGSLLN